MRRVFFLTAVLAFILSPFALGATVVDDNFDDGDIATNTLGVGSGFNSGIFSAADITEADSKVNLLNTNNGADRAVITSIDAAAIGSSGITRFEFKGLTFSSAGGTGSGGPARTVVGVKSDDLADNPDDNTKPGFYVQFENDSFSNTSNDGEENGTSALIYVAEDDTRTVLATWEFDTLNWDSGTENFTPVIDVTLDLDADGYALSIEGDTISNVTGALKNTYAGADIANELTTGYAYVFGQTEFPLINLSVDRIIVTEDAPGAITRPYDGKAIPDNGDGSVGTVNVADLSVTDVDLTFKAGADPNFADNGLLVNPDIDSFVIHFQSGLPTDPNLIVVDAIAAGSMTDPNRLFELSLFEAGDLDQGTTYKWQVEQVMINPDTLLAYAAGDPNNILSPIWSFTTANATPEILSDPYHTLIDKVTDEAQLTITASATADNFRWFKVGRVEALTDGEIDGVTYAGTDTTTLIISGMDPLGSEDAQYYAVVYNGFPGDELTQESEPSDTAWVWYPRETNRFTFEETYAVDSNSFVADQIGSSDIMLTNDDGTIDVPSIDPNNPDASGLLGSNSLYFNNPNTNDDPNEADGQFARISDTSFCAYKDLTISAWIYHKGGGWQRILSVGSTDGSGTNGVNTMYFTPSGNNNAGELMLNVNGQSISSPTGSVPQNEWAYVTATLSGDVAKLYVNGEWVATNDDLTNNPIDNAPAGNIMIARSQWWDYDSLFNGYIADMRIWNYGLSTEEVAQYYMDDDMDVEYVCDSEDSELPYDFNDNCLVDIGDLAIFAIEWMDSYRIYMTP